MPLSKDSLFSGWDCWWFRNPKQPPGMVLKPYNSWDKLATSNWCRILAINRMTILLQVLTILRCPRKWMDQGWTDQWILTLIYIPFISRWNNPLIRSPLILNPWDIQVPFQAAAGRCIFSTPQHLREVGEAALLREEWREWDRQIAAETWVFWWSFFPPKQIDMARGKT